MSKLTDVELNDYFRRLQLPKIGADYVRQVRTNPPGRSVAGGRANLSGSVPSRKMKATIQFESRTTELPYIYMLENDLNVLEFWDQPSLASGH